MKRFEAIGKIKEMAGDGVIISNIGDPSKELYSAGDRDENFYMLGSMGLASSIGLGVSIASKRKVIVLDGDGSILMNMGSLVTVAVEAADNFNLIVLDNGAYGSTGYQQTAISKKSDLQKAMTALGNNPPDVVSTVEDLERAIKGALASDKSSIIIVKVSKEHVQFPKIDIDPGQLMLRFRKNVSGIEGRGYE